MNRDRYLNALRSGPRGWDIVIIGGGATGLGAAIDAASRGARTLLLEQSDFAKGTSSRSTKLVHGGVRYLRQGNIPLVREALEERGLLIQNAPHLAHEQPFVVPSYGYASGFFYLTGLKLYDTLAGQLGLGASRWLSREETLQHIPTLRQRGLRGGVLYYDGQFDDARLAINLAQTFAELGGIPLNYMKVVSLIKENGRITGLLARDQESGEEHEIRARSVVNATGVFADSVRRLDEESAEQTIAPSQGSHIVLDRSFLPGNTALMIPKTADGRVLFAIPWLDRLLVGTTDIPVRSIDIEPRPQAEEVEYLLSHTGQYLSRTPAPEDVLSAFAGLRPLVKPPTGSRKTSKLSREHLVYVSPSGLVTVTGGKWTTYREMGRDTIDTAAETAGLRLHHSDTRDLRIHGWTRKPDRTGEWGMYGTDARSVRALAVERPGYGKKLHPNLSIHAAEVLWGARAEMARTVEDVLSRRTRSLLLDARASMEIAPAVAALLARELGRDSEWEQAQVSEFRALAEGYLVR